MMSRNLCKIFILLLVSISVSAQKNTVLKAFEQLESLPELEHGLVSLVVTQVEQESSDIQYGDVTTYMRPASVLKVLTTWVAYKELGKDFKFKTELFYSGNIQNGILYGNIYIKGSGDPTLGSDYWEATPDHNEVLSQWVAAIQSLKVTGIEGNIYAIDPKSYEESIPTTWLWEDIGNYYGAQHSELNFNENTYTIDLERRGEIGNRVQQAWIKPETELLEIEELMVHEVSKHSGDNTYIYGGPETRTICVRGTVPVGTSVFAIKGALPQPALHSAYWLYDALKERGISSTGYDTQSSLPGDLHSVCLSYSPPLLEIIERTNIASVNLYAEALLKELGRKSEGISSRNAGIKVIHEYLKQHGFESQDFFIVDGSGLSPQNFIVPTSYAELLKHIREDSESQSFIQCLSQFAHNGTLKNTMKHKSAAPFMRGKSGSIGHVLNYVGYIDIPGKSPLVFVIMIDHWDRRNYSRIKANIENVLQGIYVYYK